MLRADYKRDETAVDKKNRVFLEERDFVSKLARSKAYCRNFFSQMDDKDKSVLLGFLREFASQPFIKVKEISPDLLSKAFSSEGIYLYWVNPFSFGGH